MKHNKDKFGIDYEKVINRDLATARLLAKKEIKVSKDVPKFSEVFTGRPKIKRPQSAKVIERCKTPVYNRL